MRLPCGSNADDGRGSLPIEVTPRPSIPVASPGIAGQDHHRLLPTLELTPTAVAEEKRELQLLKSRIQELSQRLEREARERATWERRALDAESEVSRLTADLEKRPDAAPEVGLRAQLAAARHSLDHARSEAAQARRDADVAWLRVDSLRNDAEQVTTPGSSEQLRAKDQLVDQLRAEVRQLLAAAADGGTDGAARASKALEEVAILRAENADLRKMLSASLGSKRKAGDEPGASPLGAQRESTKSPKSVDNVLMAGYLTNLQKHLSETKQHSGMPVSQQVSDLELRNVETQRQLTNMTVFIDKFLYKAHRPLQQIRFVCRCLAKTLEIVTPEGEPLQALYDPNSGDMPRNIVNFLSQLRFFALFLETMAKKSQERASEC